MTIVDIVVALLMLAGLVGAILPFVPGAPLIFAGALLYGVATDFSVIGIGRLAILAALGVLAWVLEHVAGVVGARRAGGSRAAVVGMLVGVMVAPIGLLLGPIIGAIAGELLAGRKPDASVRAGIGAALGVLTGVVAHFALALVMVALFVWWVWQG